MARTRAQPSAAAPAAAVPPSPVAHAVESAASPAPGARAPESPLPPDGAGTEAAPDGLQTLQAAHPAASQAGADEPTQHQQQAGSGESPQDSREERIRRAAYRRYEARSGGPGDPVDDWLQAEAEVDGGSDPGR